MPIPDVSSQPASITVRRVAQTRRDLAEAAARLFVERGYLATTVEDIATAAGISPRTFFRYFAAKEDVIDEVLEANIATFAAALAARAPGEPLLDALRAAGRDSLARAADAGVVALFAVVRSTPTLRARWLARSNGYVDLIAASLRSRLEPDDDSLSAQLGAGALIGIMTIVVDRFIDASSDRIACVLDEAFGYFVAGFDRHR